MFSAEALLFFARTCGFFLLSPLFSKRNISVGIRLAFAFFCSLVLIPPLSVHFHLAPFPPILLLLKEAAVGYLLGFLFALIFEGALLAGQMVGTLAGFSLSELFDPTAGIENTLFTKLFSITLFTLFLALDLHHNMLRFFFESAYALPLGASPQSLSELSARLFHSALFYAFIPMLFLSFVLLTFAVITRALPDLPIFWVGFPLQLLVGMIATTIALCYFPEILQKAFFEFFREIKQLFFPL